MTNSLKGSEGTIRIIEMVWIHQFIIIKMRLLDLNRLNVKLVIKDFFGRKKRSLECTYSQIWIFMANAKNQLLF